jgi:hypothetical protein
MWADMAKQAATNYKSMVDGASGRLSAGQEELKKEWGEEAAPEAPGGGQEGAGAPRQDWVSETTQLPKLIIHKAQVVSWPARGGWFAQPVERWLSALRLRAAEPFAKSCC